LSRFYSTPLNQLIDFRYQTLDQACNTSHNPQEFSDLICSNLIVENALPCQQLLVLTWPILNPSPAVALQSVRSDTDEAMSQVIADHAFQSAGQMGPFEKQRRDAVFHHPFG